MVVIPLTHQHNGTIIKRYMSKRAVLFFFFFFSTQFTCALEESLLPLSKALLTHCYGIMWAFSKAKPKRENQWRISVLYYLSTIYEYSLEQIYLCWQVEERDILVLIQLYEKGAKLSLFSIMQYPCWEESLLSLWQLLSCALQYG